MKFNKKINQLEYIEFENQTSPQVEALPFYIKEFGYSNIRKFQRGTQNEYNDFLLLYTVEGITNFKKNDHTQRVGSDALVFSSCNSPIQFSKTSREWSYFYIIISGTSAKYYYNNIRNKQYIFNINPFSEVKDIFMSIYSLPFDGTLYSNMQASLYVHQLLLNLYEYSADILKAKQITPAQESVVNSAIKYIDGNYSNELNIDTICEQVSFSKFYFCKIFKKQTGVTIHQYVNKIRMEKSKPLLSYSKLSIAAVANSVGFKSPITFSRCFSNEYHMTPSEYREKY